MKNKIWGDSKNRIGGKKQNNLSIWLSTTKNDKG
jgi:hypothetical protein